LSQAYLLAQLKGGSSVLRLSVISPFLDRHHGTEACVVEQIERLAFQHGWQIHLYAQHVDQIQSLSKATLPVEKKERSIIWHRVSDIPGPHILKYLWWLCANHLLRWRERNFRRTTTDLTYSPGINCFDADAIVVHIVFHETISRMSRELQFRNVPLRSWHLLIHRKLYYRLAMRLETKVYQNPRV
jgi:hypothetical protein